MSETESDKTSSVSSPEEERSHRPSHEGVSEGVSEEAAEGVSEGFILKLLSGFHVGAEVALTPDTHVTIGRDESCDVILSDPSIAPQHGQLTIGKDGRAVIKGILSAEASSPETSPETFMRVAINGKPIDGEGALQQGDIITLGRLHLAYGAPETPWHQLTIPSFSDEASPPSEHGEAHGETASPSHDGEDASPSPIEGAVLTDHRDQRTERRRFSFTRTLVFICLPLGFAVVPLFFLLHGMPPMPSLPMMKATEEMTATTEDVAHGERMEEQDTSDHLPDRFHDRLHDTPHDIHAVHSAMSEAVSGAMSEAMPEGEPQHDGASSLSLAERVSMLLASMDGGRGHVTVQDSSHAVTIGGYVHTHHDLNVLRGFIEARIPDASVRSQLRYRVTSTQTLAMAIRSELESRGFHNIGIEDNGDGTFVVTGLLASTKMFHRALLEITSSLPRLKHIDDNVVTIDDVIRVIHEKTHAQGLSVSVRHVDDDEQHEGTIEVKGLVNAEDYDTWTSIASFISERYAPWLFLDDHVVNIRGFHLDVVSSISGPHSFIIIREQKSGKGHYYTKGSLLPNGFRLQEIMTDHLVLSWQGRDYTYVLGDDHDTRTTNLHP